MSESEWLGGVGLFVAGCPGPGLPGVRGTGQLLRVLLVSDHDRLALVRRRANEAHRRRLREITAIPTLDQKALNRVGRHFEEHGRTKRRARYD